MQTLLYYRLRDRFSLLTKKLVPEAFVSILAIAFVVAAFSSIMKAPSASSRAERTDFDGQIAGPSAQKTMDFMERVALAHIGEPKPSSAAAGPPPAAMKTAAAAKAIAPVEPAVAPKVTAAPAVVPPPVRLARAVAHAKPRPAPVHTADAVPTVLPPPRPPFASPQPMSIIAESPVVVSEPRKSEPLRPLRYGVHLVTQIVDFVPASGTRVFEGMASVGGALVSFAKKL